MRTTRQPFDAAATCPSKIPQVKRLLGGLVGYSCATNRWRCRLDGMRWFYETERRPDVVLMKL